MSVGRRSVLVAIVLAIGVLAVVFGPSLDNTVRRLALPLSNERSSANRPPPSTWTRR